MNTVAEPKAKDLREAIFGTRVGMRRYFVYIMTNRVHTLDIGVTNDLVRRVYEHKHKLIPGFTSRYALDRLVYFEESNDIRVAIGREKQQLKGWLRARKVPVIESVNLRWQDLSPKPSVRVPGLHEIQLWRS